MFTAWSKFTVKFPSYYVMLSKFYCIKFETLPGSTLPLGFPGGARGKESNCNEGEVSLSFLPEKSHGQKRLLGYGT